MYLVTFGTVRLNAEHIVSAEERRDAEGRPNVAVVMDTPAVNEAGHVWYELAGGDAEAFLVWWHKNTMYPPVRPDA